MRSGRLLLFDTVREAWQRCLDGGTHSLEQRADLLLAMTHTMRHHVFASDARYGTVGQVCLGVPPDFPVVAV